MGKLQKVNFNGGSNPQRALDRGSEKTVNWYPVLGPADAAGTNSVYLYPTEGLTLLSASIGGEIRGIRKVANLIYYVVGQQFCSIDEAGVIVVIGSINTSAGIVRMADIFDQVGFVDGSDGWIYTISTNTLTQITDPDFPNNATTICALQGYFVVGKPNSQDYYVSNLSDGLTWDAADFFSAQFESDELVAVFNYQDTLWLFGTSTVEQHTNVGNTNFPFEPRVGSSLLYGIAALDSLVSTGQQGQKSGIMCWLATSDRGAILPVAVDSYGTIFPIFNQGVIEEINRFGAFDDAIGFVYEREDHVFYVLTFPTEDKTYVYDIKTGLTHERQSYNALTAEYGRWLATFYATLGGQAFVTDKFNGQIYSLLKDKFDEDGTPIRRIRRMPIFRENNTYKTINDFWIIFNTGDALTIGQGSNPTAMLRVSRDGGRTFDSEMSRDIGLTGDHADSARWSMLGTSRKWCAELVVTDPIDWRVLDAFIDFTDETGT